MSRPTIHAFLSKAKLSLSQSLRSKGEHPASFVIGNESADLDSITCALVYGYLQSSTPEARKKDRCIIPVTNIPLSEVRLRPELTALLKHADLKPSDLVTLDDLGKIEDILPPDGTEWTLVDHNALQGTLGKVYSHRVVALIDHHDDEGNVSNEARPRIVENSGSCNSLVVNHLSETWDSLCSLQSSAGDAQAQTDGVANDAADTSNNDAQVAKLALGSVLIDTVNFTSEQKTTDYDRQAAKYLEAKIHASPEIGPDYDRDAFFKEIDDAKSNLDDLSLEEILRKDYKQWTEGDLILGISSVVQPVNYLQTRTDHLVSTLLEFAKGRGVDLFAVIASHNEFGTFERQLLLLPITEGEPVEVARRFTEKNSDELQLGDSGIEVDDSKALWLRIWQQQNVAASRKQVAPLLRGAMR